MSGGIHVDKGHMSEAEVEAFYRGIKDYKREHGK